MKEVSDNRGYEAKNKAATMTLQNNGTYQRQKTMLINTNLEAMKQYNYPWTIMEYHSCTHVPQGT